jgi:hypothetical protein
VPGWSGKTLYVADSSSPRPAGTTGTGELAISPNGDLLVGITSDGAVIATS